jgi:glycosyltransferase involved in cell wall biosynthesis
VAQIMAGAPEGGAELFFERLSMALHRAGDSVLPVVRRDAGRVVRLRAAGLAPAELGFGGALDVLTGARLRGVLRRFAPRVAVAWMGRAARFAPRGEWVLVGRLGGYYDLSRFRRCDHLVANTRGLAAWVVAQGWPGARVHHLPNFVPDLAGAAAWSRGTAGPGRLAGAPGRLAVPEGVPVVLALGRLHRNKGFDVLVRAMRELPGVHAVIAGEGPERAALERLARDEGVAGRVHLPGWTQDGAGLLAACDVLVCPSRQEPLGNVVLEAFSAARPVVAAAAAGPAGLIEDRRTGLLVAVEDERALAGAIGAVLGDRVLAARLAAGGRAEFERVHAEVPVLAQWRAFLGSVERR